MRFLPGLLLLPLLVSGQAAQSTPVTKRPLTVVDVVEMTNIVEPDVRLGRTVADFKFSPDQAWFAIVTRTGNLTVATNEHQLLLYSARAVLDYVNADGESLRPKPQLLFRAISADREITQFPAIRDLAWSSDSKELLFLAHENDAPAQVYKIAIDSQRLSKLTSYAGTIFSFSHHAASDTTLFLAKLPTGPLVTEGFSYVVGTRELAQVLLPAENPGFHKSAFFVARNGQVQQVNAPPIVMTHGLLSPVWLSPDGRFAVSRWRVTDESVARRWEEEYAVVQASDTQKRLRTSDFDSAYMGEGMSGFTQLVLIDVTSLTARPLINSPDAVNFYPFAGSPVHARWRPDSQSVIVANTLLPLDGGDSGEIVRRSQYPAVAEVNIKTGAIAWVAELTPREKWTEGSPESFRGIKSFTGDQIEIAIGDTTKRFHRTENGWHSRPSDVLEPNDSPLEMWIRQEATTAPDLWAKDRRTQRERAVTDFNPQFREVSFGEVRPFDWQDPQGNTWRGGVVYPPGYVTGKRYPVVIQTYGFRIGEFVIDGPYRFSTAFAAQPLANRGMLVLLLPNVSAGGTYRGRLLHMQAGIEAAIQALDRAGLVEHGKVGLVGFSATGIFVQQMITFSDAKIAAATIADSWNFNLLGYTTYLFGMDAPGMKDAEAATGAVPWGKSLSTWVERDPTLHVDQIEAALMIQHNGAWVNPYWDIYTILRRQHKPAEFVAFPRAPHQLRNPQQRFDSMQANVDWMCYWLDGQERTEVFKEANETPEKLTAQFIRWRKLRELREADLKKGETEKTRPAAPSPLTQAR